MNIPEPKKILVIKIRALGDTLLATPALRALRQAYPASEITALVSAQGKAVLANNPHLNSLAVYEPENPWQETMFLPRVWLEHYDLAIALHASFRTALLALATGARQRVVHNHSGRNYFSTLPIPAAKESKSAIQRDLDAIRALGIAGGNEPLEFPVLPEALGSVREFLARSKVSEKEGFWVLAPGAGKERKRWSQEAARTFLDQAAERVPGRWLILAGPQEQGLAQSLAAAALSHPLIFRGSIQEAGALLSLCRGLVTMDSGPKHVAVAVGARTLTLWTDEPVAEWHPYDVNQHALVLSATGEVKDIKPQAVLAAFVKHFQ